MEGAWGTSCSTTEGVCSTLTCGATAWGVAAATPACASAAARFRPRLAACPLSPLARRLSVEFQRFLMALSVLRVGSQWLARLVWRPEQRRSQEGL